MKNCDRNVKFSIYFCKYKLKQLYYKNNRLNQAFELLRERMISLFEILHFKYIKNHQFDLQDLSQTFEKPDKDIYHYESQQP